MTEEFEVLQQINNDSGVKQRDISANTGMSLGAVNLVIKSLVKKGYLTAKRINSRNIKYLVTPSGLEMLSRKTFNYYKKTVFIVREYQQKVDLMVERIAQDGYDSVRIIGVSSLELLLENSCRRYRLEFLSEELEGRNTCLVYSEDCLDQGGSDSYYLKDIL
ncbi:MAG: winged helix-turn-helix transcriptional regulator [Spirochaetales bacterium]|nr:winged helix-turn-helix transcriptional regulator [Spirochaetales bacterium]